MAKTIFITGISASGKTTLGKRLEEDLKKRGIDDVKLLDGEDIREKLEKRGKHYGYTTKERNKVVLAYAHMAQEYNREGVNCILCTIAHMRDTRRKMKTIMGDVIEVYLDCPIDICAGRDYKGQYAKAFKGLCDNFIGVTDHYQKSDSVNLILHTGIDSAEKCSAILLEAAMAFFAPVHKK